MEPTYFHLCTKRKNIYYCVSEIYTMEHDNNGEVCVLYVYHVSQRWWKKKRRKKNHVCWCYAYVLLFLNVVSSSFSSSFFVPYTCSFLFFYFIILCPSNFIIFYCLDIDDTFTFAFLFFSLILCATNVCIRSHPHHYISFCVNHSMFDQM